MLDALDKRHNSKRTKFDDVTVERGLEYADSRPFAVFATMGVRSGWAATQASASQMGFIAAGVLFDDRGMHLHTISDETDTSKVAEFQMAFGKILLAKAEMSEPPDPRVERIANLLIEAQPGKGPFAKFRRSHLYNLIPTRRLEAWFAPFVEQ